MENLLNKMIESLNNSELNELKLKIESIVNQRIAKEDNNQSIEHLKSATPGFRETLELNGIYTIRQLANTPKKIILSMRGVGSGTVEKLEIELRKRYNLDLM